MKKRSNAPIFWALFGGGGMLSALTGPALIFITGLAIPLGLLPHDMMSYPRMLAFAQNIFGKLCILAVIILFLWHAAHRIFKSLHDVGIHPSPASKMACYGTAFICSVLAIYAVLVVGF
ncbi:MAG TPA: fumarate reductase subunit FrdD [Noviherbaspirillum sp.]|uniref:fumarate reductase subunit FrdD n=1 Tax=Noviherbaspirillum sp. TaxID=1926288 RepID=UPI002B47FAA5|nr:fumarate reductase subunit FrdD [Noviherbaspirillum sp.]HJV88023.1 fumarate reductase subunit FrdD [Noviherbaspirillum sp.]